MSGRATFSCLCFRSAGTTLALPIRLVDQVLDPDPNISHISDYLGQERAAVATRVLSLHGESADALRISVDTPVGVTKFHVDEVVPASAGEVGPLHEGLIDHEGELILMLDPEPLIAALVREQNVQHKETD